MDYPSYLGELFDSRAGEEALASDAFPDMHCIMPGLYLGNQRAAGVLFPFEERDIATSSAIRGAALKSLEKAGIRNIICCSSVDDKVFDTDGIVYECSLLADGSSAEIIASTPAFEDLLGRAIRLRARNSNEGTLVHCASGAHRSAALCVAFSCTSFRSRSKVYCLSSCLRGPLQGQLTGAT